ncbi:MAG: transketolase family protein [Clostridiales bacterium]|nr:transketolase family protein [Clostridiales bacterium]
MLVEKEMRQVLASELSKYMEIDESIVVVDADLARANGTLGLREKFPDRALDVGVAECNMASVAAGLASYGFKPFITSFCPFATRRICDQITISIVYAKQNVKIVGTDPGLSAEFNGGTHMSVEDIGVLRSIPGMVIFEPVDQVQLYKAFPQILEYEGPMYIRLFRKKPDLIFDEDSYEFDLFKVDTLVEGTDVTLFASGIQVKQALDAAEMLKKDGISAEVINVHTIKPIDKSGIIESARKTGCVVTCENHNIHGGLGSAIAEVLSEHYPVPMKYIGFNDCFSIVGRTKPLLEKFGMTKDHIYEKALEVIKMKKKLSVDCWD